MKNTKKGAAHPAPRQNKIRGLDFRTSEERKGAVKADAKRQGITYTKWLEQAIDEKLDCHWHKKGIEMDCRTALATVLDQVDYTAGNCRPNEMVGAVLPKEVIVLARQAIAEFGG